MFRSLLRSRKIKWNGLGRRGSPRKHRLDGIDKWFVLGIPAGVADIQEILDAQPNAHGGSLLDGMFCWTNTPISSHLLCLDFVRRARPLRRRHDLRAVWWFAEPLCWEHSVPGCPYGSGRNYRKVETPGVKTQAEMTMVQWPASPSILSFFLRATAMSQATRLHSILEKYRTIRIHMFPLFNHWYFMPCRCCSALPNRA